MQLSYLIAVIIGAVIGMTGSGGSLLLPTFTYLCGLPVQLATGYTLVLTGLSAAFGTIPRFKSGDIDFVTAITLALPLLLSTIIVRGWVFDLIPSALVDSSWITVSRRQAIMMLFVCLVLLSWASMTGLIGSKFTPTPNLRQTSPLKYFSILISCGLAIGAVSAFVGAGGGVMLVPLLVVVIGLPIKTVVGTTLLIVAIKSITGFSGDVLSQFASIDWVFLARFMLAMAIGVFVGSNVAQRIDPTVLKRSFSWFLLFIALFVSAKELLELRSTTPQREQQETHQREQQETHHTTPTDSSHLSLPQNYRACLHHLSRKQ